MIRQPGYLSEVQRQESGSKAEIPLDSLRQTSIHRTCGPGASMDAFHFRSSRPDFDVAVVRTAKRVKWLKDIDRAITQQEFKRSSPSEICSNNGDKTALREADAMILSQKQQAKHVCMHGTHRLLSLGEASAR